MFLLFFSIQLHSINHDRVFVDKGDIDIVSLIEGDRRFSHLNRDVVFEAFDDFVRSVVFECGIGFHVIDPVLERIINEPCVSVFGCATSVPCSRKFIFRVLDGDGALCLLDEKKSSETNDDDSENDPTDEGYLFLLHTFSD